MNPITINQTERSPGISFDFASGAWRIWGESYPEDSAAFFGPVLRAVQEDLSEGNAQITLNVELYYFNSSSAKALMTLFQSMEDAAKSGRSITVNWCFDASDDTMEEFGEDFSEDFNHGSFNLCPRS